MVNAHDEVLGLFSWMSEAEIEGELEGLENAEWVLEVEDVAIFTPIEYICRCLCGFRLLDGGCYYLMAWF